MNYHALSSSTPPHGFIPVLSPRFPLDTLLAPYAARLSGHALISLPELHAANLTRLHLPPLKLLLDSGGYAALQGGSAVLPLAAGRGALKLPGGRTITPEDVLRTAQDHRAHASFTLDFPARTPEERALRDPLSLANARWALRQPRSGLLYASVQPGQDLAPILELRPDGLALGGLVPHARDLTWLHREVGRVRARIGPTLPLHVFGIGHPEGVRTAMRAGATSVDSSGPQRRAADSRTWDGTLIPDPAPHERLRLAVLNLDASVRAARIEVEA